MDKSLPPNAALSHYRIVSKLGAGGMGKYIWRRTSNYEFDYLAQNQKI